MAKHSIQFHATPEELESLADTISDIPGLSLTGMFFPPHEVRPIARENLRQAMSEPRLRDLVFTVGPPSPAPTKLRFVDLNPNSLFLSVGRMAEAGLEESCLATPIASDESIEELWRELSKLLRGMTSSGAVAVNSDTGAKANARNHRFTEGARALFLAGVKIFGAAGPRGVHLQLGKSE